MRPNLFVWRIDRLHNEERGRGSVSSGLIRLSFMLVAVASIGSSCTIQRFAEVLRIITYSIRCMWRLLLWWLLKLTTIKYSDMGTKDLCVKLLLSGLLIFPAVLHAQTRVCIINECKYPNDLTRFLPLQKVFADYRFTSDVTQTNIPIETYFFETAKSTKHKTGIKNRDASFMVAFETACRLVDEGYHTTVPTHSELKTLREGFHTYDYDYSAKGRKNKFRTYLADYYSADVLLILLDSPFNLSYCRNVKGNGRTKTVDAEMDMSCINSWGIFNAKKGQIVKKFTTTGRGDWQWAKITSEIARNHDDSRYKMRIEGNYYIFGSWSLLPYIKDIAMDAASFIENNL